MLFAIRLPEMKPLLVISTPVPPLPTMRLKVAVTDAPALRPTPGAPSTELRATQVFAPARMPPKVIALSLREERSPAVRDPPVSVLEANVESEPMVTAPLIVLLTTAPDRSTLMPPKTTLAITMESAPVVTPRSTPLFPSWP